MMQKSDEAKEPTENAPMRLRVAVSVALTCLAALASTPASAEPRAVIELFTSQGCSSCPAADRLLAEYARDSSVIALSLAVDYWDYLGWKDTLALNGHTKRQRAYAQARGDREVYTPQVVVDGVAHALGSDKVAIEKAIRKIRDERAPLSLPVTMTQNGGTLTVTVPSSADGSGQAEVWLCPITKSVHVTIGRGENSGHTLTYSNVVRRWIKLGDWSGKAETFTVPVKDIRSANVDGAAVVVQNGLASAPKLIVGAAQLGLQ